MASRAERMRSTVAVGLSHANRVKTGTYIFGLFASVQPVFSSHYQTADTAKFLTLNVPLLELINGLISRNHYLQTIILLFHPLVS